MRTNACRARIESDIKANDLEAPEMMRRDERYVNWVEPVHQAEREAADARATPRRDIPSDAISEPRTGAVETPVQQPHEITEDIDDEDMNIDYEATSDGEECGPSSEEEVDAESPSKRQRLGQLCKQHLEIGTPLRHMPTNPGAVAEASKQILEIGTPLRLMPTNQGAVAEASREVRARKDQAA